MCIDHTLIGDPPSVSAPGGGPPPTLYELNPTTGKGCSPIQGTLTLDSGLKYYKNDCTSDCQRCEIISTMDGNMFIQLRCRVC